MEFLSTNQCGYLSFTNWFKTRLNKFTEDNLLKFTEHIETITILGSLQIENCRGWKTAQEKRHMLTLFSLSYLGIQLGLVLQTGE